MSGLWSPGGQRAGLGAFMAHRGSGPQREAKAKTRRAQEQEKGGTAYPGSTQNKCRSRARQPSELFTICLPTCRSWRGIPEGPGENYSTLRARRLQVEIAPELHRLAFSGRNR